MAIVGEAFVEIKPQIAANFNQQVSQQIGAPLEKAGVAAGKKASDALSKGASKGAEDAGKTAGKKFGVGLGDALQGLGAIVVARKVFGFFKDSISTLAEFEKLGAQTSAAIRSTGGAANVSAKQVAELAGSLEDLTTIDDKAIQGAANLLLTFTNVRNEVGDGNDVFNQAVATLTDMSVALGTDVSGSAIQLGKALNDPIAGITALTRVGVTFTEQQKNQIKTLVESGQTLEAQKIILAELNKEFGGSAEALGNTFQGKLNRAADAFEELQKNVGAAIAPIVESLAEIATLAAKVPGPIIAAGAAFAGLVAVGIGIVKVRKVIGDTVSELGKLLPSSKRAAEGLADVGDTAGGVGKVGKALGALGGTAALLGGLAIAGEALGDFLTKADREATKRAIPKLTEAMIELGQESRAAVGGLAGAGRTLEEVFAAVTGGSVSDVAKSFETLRFAIDSSVPGLQDFADIFDQILVDIQSKSPDDAAAAYAELIKTLGLAPDKAAEVFDDYAIALGETANAAKIAGTEQGNLNNEADDGTSAFDELEKALSDYNKALDETLGVTLDAQEASDNLTKAKKDLAEAVKENGPIFKGNSDAALENRDALRDVVDAANEYADAQILAGKASLSSKPDLLTKALNDLAATYPGLKTQIQGYINKLNAVPESVNTTVDLQIPSPSKLKAFVKKLESQLVALSPLLVPGGAHTGGWIGGYGAGAFDIPITAQGGEFMLQRSSAGLTAKAFGPGFLSMWNQASNIDQLRRLFGGLKLHAGGPVPTAVASAGAVITFAPQITIIESKDGRDTATQVTRALGRTSDDLRRVKGRG